MQISTINTDNPKKDITQGGKLCTHPKIPQSISQCYTPEHCSLPASYICLVIKRHLPQTTLLHYQIKHYDGVQMVLQQQVLIPLLTQKQHASGAKVRSVSADSWKA